MERIHELTRKQAGSFYFPDQSVEDREASHWFGQQTFKHYDSVKPFMKNGRPK